MDASRCRLRGDLVAHVLLTDHQLLFAVLLGVISQLQHLLDEVYSSVVLLGLHCGHCLMYQ